MELPIEKRGIILMFLSRDRFSAKNFDYNYVKDGIDYDQKYPGIQTGDAPVRFLLSEARKDKMPISKIICIVTEEDEQVQVKGEYVNPEKISTFDRFKRIVETECSAPNDTPDIIPIKLNMDLPSQERTRLLYKRITGIIEKEENYSRVNVYLDYTGGFRDVSYLMTAIIQYLQFKGINCQRIIYSDLFKHKLYDLGYLYAMTDLISSVGEFLSTGNASRLLQVIDRSSAPDETWINDFLKSIVAFSDSLTLCNMQDLDKAAMSVCDCLKNKPEKDNAAENALGLYQEMLMTLVPEIQDKLHLEEGNVSYPGLIHWCLDNRMLQQAATLYVEKMPIFYFTDENEKKLIPPEVHIQINERIKEGTLPGTGWETTAFYTDLFEYMGHDRSLDEFKEAVLKLSDYRDLAVPFKPNPDLPLKLNPASKMRTIRQSWHDKSMSDSCISALDRLESYVRRHISTRGKCDIYDRVYSLNLNKKRLDLFLKDLAKRNDGLFIFMYPKKEYKKPENDINHKYRQKYASISVIKEDNRIKKRMLYYLAAKLIRNRMNHAAEEISEDEKALSNFLKKDGIIYDGTISSIDKILRDGLKLT